MLFRRVSLLILVVALITTVGIIVKDKITPTKQQNLAETKAETTNKSEVKGIEAVPTAKPELTNKPTSRTVYFGMWTQGFWDPSTNTLHPEALTTVESKISKKAAIAHYYRGWEALDSADLLTELNTISSHRWRPMISTNPYFFSKCPANGLSLYKAIASGNCDELLTNIGKNLAKFGKPLFLRFAWEMNTPSMSWEIAKTGSSNQDFIDAWKRMHSIIYSEGATNVLWIFSPDVANIHYQDFYPGDGFVDWVGLDGYNWGTTQTWSKWQNFSQIFSAAYYSITKLAPNKPLMISEVNTTDQGGDKPSWYTDALVTQIPTNFPRIKAVVLYNEDRTKQESVNWLIDITKSSLASFASGIQNSIYLSSF